jgi:hypothetical protein
VDRRAVGEIALEVEAEALLGSAADGYDDVLGADAVDTAEEGGVLDDGAVERGHVDVVSGDSDSLLLKPVEIELCTGGTGHDPERVAWLADIGLVEKFAEIFEAGEATDTCALEAVPDENHEGRVGDGEVGVEEGFAVVGVAIEVFEGRSGWNNKKAAIA